MHLIIEYDACEIGYTVTTNKASGGVLDVYEAGNSPNESTAYEPDPRYALPTSTLWKYAESTANEIAEERRAAGHTVIVVRPNGGN